MSRPTAQFRGLPLLVLAATCSLLALTPPAALHAQLPVTELNTVYPLGGKAGSTVEVRVTGANLDDAETLLFSHPEITGKPKMRPAGEFDEAAQPEPGVFEVTIGANAPQGLHEVRVRGRFGVSNPRLFAVAASDVTEVLDAGNNATPETAQEVPVGSAINGQVDASRVDYYQVPLGNGERVLIECRAGRLDSRLDGVLVVLDEQGRELARNRDSIGFDPLIDFTAPATGKYVIGLYDSIYAGGADYAYRLTIDRHAHLDFVLPAAVQTGATAKVQVFGRNLPGGQTVKDLAVDGSPLEQAPLEVQAPADPEAVPSRIYTSLPGSVLDAFTIQLPGTAPRMLGIARHPVLLEVQTDNDQAPAAQPLTVPCDLTGQFYPERDVDWYQFEAKQGDVLWIEVLSHRLGLDSDPVMLIQRVTRNDKGEEMVSDVAMVDDPGDRNGRIGSDFDTSTDDPVYRLAVGADGTYRIMVRDQFGDARRDPRFVYRLVVRPETPDFSLLATPKQIKVANANQVLQYAPVVRRGGASPIEISVARHDGFTGEVEVQISGLPQGVSCQPIVISEGSTSGTLILEASEDAAPGVGEVQIVGKARIGDQDVVRRARPSTVVWGTANRTQTAPEFRAAQRLLVAVIDKELAPATVSFDLSQPLKTSLGGTLEVPVKLTRRAADAELKWVATGVPAELKPADLTIKKGESAGKLELKLTNAKAKPGVYDFYLRADTAVKYTQNPQAIQEAEAQQKRLEELLKTLAEEVKQTAAKRDEAVKAAQVADAAVKQAEQAEKTHAAALAKFQQAQAAADAQLAKAEQAAKDKADDAALAKQLEDARQAAEAARKATEDAAVKAAEAKQAAEKAQAAAKQATEAKQAAEKLAADTVEKNKRATAAKQAADKNLDTVKKANAEKNVNVAIVSPSIRLEVVASPITLAPAAAELNLASGGTVELPVKIERLFGYADAVELTATLPKGLAGVSVDKATVAKDGGDAKLTFTASDKATAGDHPVTIKASGKFNNVAVTTETTVTLHLTAAAKEEAAQK